jgi:hypothetical protein
MGYPSFYHRGEEGAGLISRAGVFPGFPSDGGVIRFFTPKIKNPLIKRGFLNVGCGGWI